MDQSTHYNLNLVTGSDKVNPLTVDRPNYETIDEQMYKNQTAAISEATELKSGTVHAITCLTEGAVFFRFTATSDFAAGDTFTFNGTPVSAVLPDGSGLQAGVFKINGTVLCSIVGTLLTVYSITASGIASDSEKLGGQLPAYYAKATDAISTYVHSRIGTVNNFVGTGANGKVKIVANIQAGDTIQINGQPVTAFAGADDFVSTVAGQNLVGKTLFFLWDSTSNIVNFKSGGGKGVVDCGWIAWANILASTTFTSAIVPSAGKGKNYDFNASSNRFSTTYQNNALTVEVTKSGTYALNIFAFRARGGTAFCQILKNGQPLFNSENTPVFPGYTGDIATSAQIIAQLYQGDVLTLQGRSSSGQDCVVHLSAVAAK